MTNHAIVYFDPKRLSELCAPVVARTQPPQIAKKMLPKDVFLSIMGVVPSSHPQCVSYQCGKCWTISTTKFCASCFSRDLVAGFVCIDTDHIINGEIVYWADPHWTHQNSTRVCSIRYGLSEKRHDLEDYLSTTKAFIDRNSQSAFREISINARMRIAILQSYFVVNPDDLRLPQLSLVSTCVNFITKTFEFHTFELGRLPLDLRTMVDDAIFNSLLKFR